MSLVVFTALVGLLIAPVQVHPVIGFTALLAIAVGAGASGALNMWWDADIDARDAAHARPPHSLGPIEGGEALGFGMILSALSVFTLGVVTNWVAAGLLAFTIFFYAVVYTMWLKRSTPQNIVIGGAAGAFPPVVGYAAATGASACRAWRCSPSSSSGRRRISGPWRWSRAANTPAPACR
jgi:protoheme IX farnesyltransferase